MDSKWYNLLGGLIVMTFLFSFAPRVLAQSSGAPTFPPEPVTGPFPFGTEPVRRDAPIDADSTVSDTTRGPSGIFHEYTCYHVSEPPVIDGEIEEDPVWNQIPWTICTYWETTWGQEFSIFSGETSDTWDGFENCTAWWKMLWDGENVYFAFEVYDDVFNPNQEPENPPNLHAYDCIQMMMHMLPPEIEEYEGMKDEWAGAEFGFAITDWNGWWEEMFTNWTWSGTHPFANTELQLAEGNNTSGNVSTNGKAFFGSVEETIDYYITRFEFQFVLDSMWLAQAVPGAIGRISVFYLDHESETDKYQGVNWGDVFGGTSVRTGSVLYSGDPPPATSVENASTTAPREFALEQNYPNPFNPSTTICFSIPRRETVTLSVYNLLGEKVANLIDHETKSAGRHSVTFDAEDLVNGIYFYRLEAGNHRQIKSMLLLK